MSQKIAVKCSVLLLCLCGSVFAQRERPIAPLEVVDVFGDGDALLLSVSIGEKEYLCLLDTGATVSMFDLSIPLGDWIRTETMSTGDGDVTLKVFPSPKLILGRTLLRGKGQVYGLDLKAVREISGHNIMGVIGTDILANYVVQIDFDKGKLSFLRSIPANAGKKIELHYVLTSVEPWVFLQLPGRPGLAAFLLDTGLQGSGMMEKGLLEELAGRGAAKRVGKALAVNFGGARVAPMWQVSEVSVEQWKLQKLLMRQDNLSAFGLGFLSRYVVTFDFPGAHVYLKEGNRIGLPDRRNMTGLRFGRRLGKTFVHSVVESSLAAKAGIKNNDAVLKVGAKDADSTRLMVLESMLGGDDPAVPMTISRDGKVMQISLPLREPR